MARVICFDIDGVLTREADTKPEDLTGTYAYRSPNTEAIEVVRQAIAAGWTIILHTGRKEGHRRLTENWLFAHNIPYHFLFMDKPYYRYVVDDRAVSIEKLRSIVGPAGGDD